MRFKAKFNYLIFWLRLFFGIFTLCVFVVFILVSPELFKSFERGLKFYIGFLAGLFLYTYLPYRFFKMAYLQRESLFIYEDYIQIDKILSKTLEDIPLIDFKGYSISRYPTKLWNFKEVILYLKNGKKIEIPQFLYINFKDFLEALQKSKLTHLGYEPYKWKFPDGRKFLFD